jgi:hypothetical protein
MSPTALMQISVSRTAEENLIVPAHRSSLSRRATELTTLRKQLAADSMGAQVAFGLMDRMSPHAIAISDAMLARLDRLHLLLGRALIDLVDRWFSDEAARLPHRMPLDPEEEVLLKWVAGAGFVPKYSEHAGCWRSDVLFGRSPDGLDDEAPYICEINGRLPLNGTIVTGQHASGITQLGAGKPGFETVNSLKVSTAATFLSRCMC